MTIVFKDDAAMSQSVAHFAPRESNFPNGTTAQTHSHRARHFLQELQGWATRKAGRK